MPGRSYLGLVTPLAAGLDTQATISLKFNSAWQAEQRFATSLDEVTGQESPADARKLFGCVEPE